MKSLTRPVRFKSVGVGVLAAVLTLGLYTENVSAKRMGGGRSIGRSSHNMPHHPSPAKQAVKPAQSPTKAQPSEPGVQRNRWLGPIAGLAAGLGIAALLSHFGLGGAMGGMLSNLLVIAGIMLLAYWGIRMLAKRRIPTVHPGAELGRHEPFSAASTATSSSSSLAAEAKSIFSTRNTQHRSSAQVQQTAQSSETVDSSVSVPSSTISFASANFDGVAFLRYAKVQFIRMQDAWDKGDLDDIREFTTPEMFAEIKLDLSEREASAVNNHTNVEKLDAALLSMQAEADWHYASVQFSGLILEEPEQETAEPFSEIWNFSKRITLSEVDTGTAKWMLAGIEQNTAH